MSFSHLENNCLPDSLVLKMVIIVIVNAGYRNGDDVSNIAVSIYFSAEKINEELILY